MLKRQEIKREQWILNIDESFTFWATEKEAEKMLKKIQNMILKEDRKKEITSLRLRQSDTKMFKR